MKKPNPFSQIEESLNLPSLEEIQEDIDREYEDEYDEDDNEDNEFSDVTYDELKTTVAELNKKINDSAAHSSISVKETEKFHRNIEELYRTSKEGFDTIFDSVLAMEATHGAKFLQGAAKLLDIALKAQNSSMDKQIEMAKLQLEREKLKSRPTTPKLVYEKDKEVDGDMPSLGQGENGGRIFDRTQLADFISKKGNNNE